MRKPGLSGAHIYMEAQVFSPDGRLPYVVEKKDCERTDRLDLREDRERLGAVNLRADEEAEAAASTLDSEFGRTTDPVRMYMREMGSVELLTREGEIEIAKRIEEGLKHMIMAISACPMTVAQILDLAGKIATRAPLVVEAAKTGDRSYIYHAAAMDPHTAADLSLEEIYKLVDALIAEHGTFLPKALRIAA